MILGSLYKAVNNRLPFKKSSVAPPGPPMSLARIQPYRFMPRTLESHSSSITYLSTKSQSNSISSRLLDRRVSSENGRLQLSLIQYSGNSKYSNSNVQAVTSSPLLELGKSCDTATGLLAYIFHPSRSAIMDLAQSLLRSCVRTFFNTRCVLVIDALIQHSAYVSWVGSHMELK